MTSYPTADFFTLKGQILTYLNVGNCSPLCYGKLSTTTAQYIFDHEQSCCEDVRHFITLGDKELLYSHSITLAEEDSNPPPLTKLSTEQQAEVKELLEDQLRSGNSHTWSSYYLEAGGHRVEIYFLGESNGYYNEDVKLYRTVTL